LAIDKAQATDLSSPNQLSSVDPLAMPNRNLRTTAAGDSKANAQRNFTDPDSQIFKGGDGWIQGYNCQVGGDGAHQIIVEGAISNHASDAPHLQPMVERIMAKTSEQRWQDAYLSNSRQQDGQRPRPSRGGPAAKDLDARERMDRKIRSKAGQANYALGKTIVKPVFGQIKGVWAAYHFL
jgi:hypothetical protein